MGCGCGKPAGESFTVQVADGTVKRFDTKAEAETFAIKHGGGMVKRA